MIARDKKTYHVKGADRSTGESRTITVDADNEQVATRRANELGLVVSSVSESTRDAPRNVAASSEPNIQRKARRPKQRHRVSTYLGKLTVNVNRSFVRFIVGLCASIVMVAGLIVFAGGALMVIMQLSNNDLGSTTMGNVPGAISVAAITTGWSLGTALSASLLFLFLYIEDHLHAIRHSGNR